MVLRSQLSRCSRLRVLYLLHTHWVLMLITEFLSLNPLLLLVPLLLAALHPRLVSLSRHHLVSSSHLRHVYLVVNSLPRHVGPVNRKVQSETCLPDPILNLLL